MFFNDIIALFFAMLLGCLSFHSTAANSSNLLVTVVERRRVATAEHKHEFMTNDACIIFFILCQQRPLSDSLELSMTAQAPALTAVVSRAS